MTDHGVLVHPALFEQYFVYLMILELCTFSSLMLSYALFQRLLTSKRIFHPNLTTILLFQPIFLIIATFIRQFRHILQVINLINGFSFQICSFFSEALAAVCLNMTSSYAIERYIAMRNLENYENKYPNNHIGLKIILGTLTLLVFDLIVFYTSLLPGWLAYGISYVVQIVGIFFFYHVYRICKQKYLEVWQKRYSTIDARYNTQGNFKASRLLLRLAPYKSITSILLLAEYQFLVDRTLYAQTFYTYVFFYLMHAQIIIQMWLIIFLEPMMKLKLKAMLRPRVKPVVPALRNVFGEQLIYNNFEESDIYFKHFNAMLK
ncbi:unnamed protein product, partial [Mesorhabditis belari]|uniref:Uncharacterized protein n=1 Tax=Mesorhabditis belari TaxID=2138241 RepID=A0AAF3EZM9_9BILA